MNVYRQRNIVRGRIHLESEICSFLKGLDRHKRLKPFNYGRGHVVNRPNTVRRQEPAGFGMSWKSTKSIEFLSKELELESRLEPEGGVGAKAHVVVEFYI